MKLYIQLVVVCVLSSMLLLSVADGCMYSCIRKMIKCKRDGKSELSDCCLAYQKCTMLCKGEPAVCPYNKRGSWNKRAHPYNPWGFEGDMEIE